MSKKTRVILTIVLLVVLLAMNYISTLKQPEDVSGDNVANTIAVLETKATESVTEKAAETVTESVTEKAAETVTESVTEKATETVTEKVTEVATESVTEKTTEASTKKEEWHTFATKKQYEDHYQKHVVTQQEFGNITKEQYLQMANDLINAIGVDPEVLTKSEKEDGDLVIYKESTNEFAILRPDGVIRTYFKPSAGIDYYNRQ